MLALLFVLLTIDVLATSQYDEWSNAIITQQISDWYVEFDQALHIKPVDAEQIYKLWNRGLVLNYYQKYDRNITEHMFINAYKLISNNTKIIRRMTAHPKNGVPNPFQRLYRSSTETLQKELHLLAMKGKWDLTLSEKRKKQAHIATNQETLRLLRDYPRKYISEKLPLIPSVLLSLKEYFRNLTLSSPSWTQIEIAITTFQLSMDTLPVSRHYYPDVVAHYLTGIAQDMALITIGNLKQAEKIINILSDQEAEFIKAFMNKRQQLIDHVTLKNFTKIQADDAEILVARLRTIGVVTFSNQQLQISQIFKLADGYLKSQAQSNETTERYLFCIALFKEAMLYSKALDNFYNSEYMIGVKYLKSMVKSIAKIIPFDPEIAVMMSSLFQNTYPELQKQLFVNVEHKDEGEFYLDFS